ncbi:odorant receptor 13a [Scaptodrosophila lebanonensis]|uniref:Odorant receptor n=1 Tax=Drosophila lebanonensis TaxID=7225 RepID=A0A6J2TUR7_DROLE|nr:odorant receptor 13a [Scaptodrosophila lebanonensis]
MFSPQSPRDPNFRIPFQCIWLKLNGSWPLTDGLRIYQPLGFAYTVWAWYVIVSVCITICFQTAFLVNNFGDIMMTTENCCTTFMGALNFVRLLHMRLNQSQFRNLIERFVDTIWISDDAHPQIAGECRKHMNTFRIMTALLACLILMYCVLPLVELFLILGLDASEKPFPYKMQFFYDPYKSWLHYVLTYFFTSYAGICVVTTLFAEDSILGFFITYTCGQFRLLHERIDGLIAASNLRGNPDEVQRKYVLRLQSIARQHERLLSFSRLLEEFFNPILLVNLMISSLLICMVGFQLVTGKNMFIGDYVKFVVYISSSISQLYILCGNGDTLIQHSTETAMHLYACNWESGNMKYSRSHAPTDKEFRTNLQIMILRSQRPVKITAFKFSTLSLQSFTAILSTSMSYFTLLQSVYIDNQP